MKSAPDRPCAPETLTPTDEVPPDHPTAPEILTLTDVLVQAVRYPSDHWTERAEPTCG